jgi:hypothetical protein
MVLPVADEGALLLLGDQTDVLANIAFCFPLGQVLAVLGVDWGGEGVGLALLDDAGKRL